jgi:hypothetical protein
MMGSNTLASCIVGGNSAFGRNKSDFYPTPPEATQALLDFLHIPPSMRIWEPACGEGHMVEVMERNGLDVIGTDIQQGTDFLTAELPEGVDWIITNPPFSLAEDFIKKCCSHDVPFALLLKSQYWHAARRLSLFLAHPPMYVLPLTWRPDFTFKTRGKGSPLMDVIWCVWGLYNAPTEYIPLAKPVSDWRMNDAK